MFDLSGGWQKITLGFKIDSWVAVWVNDTLVQYIDTDVVHDDPSGDVVEIGKVNTNSSTPSGSILIDNVSFQIPSRTDLWVNASSGSDANTGLTSAVPLRTIQRAASLAGPGTIVHIQSGVYREQVWPFLDGNTSNPVTYQAEDGPGTVILRGSDPSSSLTWTQLTANTINLPASVDPANIYMTDLTSWNLTNPPRFIVQLDAGGQVDSRLPLAHEPDWQVTTEWKYHQYWWAADGGSESAACDPITNSDHNCDYSQRSMTQLTDRTNDPEPGIESGNLTTLGDLTGATLVAIDTLQGHYVYRRTITAHDVSSGRVTVDRVCEHDSGSNNPGLGWGSKYYVEGKPILLDTPGEWWYDTSTHKLYLYPLTPGNPASQNIEISRRDHGFKLTNRSYTTLNGLRIELVNSSAIYQANWTKHKSYHNTVKNMLLQYANYGLYIEQDVSASESPANVIDGFTFEDSEIAYIDSQGIRLIDWWDNNAAPDSFTHSGILNTIIRNNEMHHLGFRTDGDNAVGLAFQFANKLRFEGNYIHHIAHNGVQFSKSVIQSPLTYGFSPSEIKTGEILIKDNIFEKACQLTTDCGGLKFWGSPPDSHVFRDVLITGNVFRNSYGWTDISTKRQRWMGGQSSDVRGLGGFGLYMDHASGFHIYRNISYNNAFTDYMAYGVWRDAEMIYYNNIAANTLFGFSLGGGQYDTHGSVNTQVVNNLILNNEGFGLSLSYASGSTANIIVDRNLYFGNGWRSYEQGGLWHAGAVVIRDGSSYDTYPTLAEAQAATPWEDHGIDGDPNLWNYAFPDHAIWDGSWPDFHLTSSSLNAIDKGSSSLPPSLAALLRKFGGSDRIEGSALDIGRFEAGATLVATPISQVVEPGGTVIFTLSLFPSDTPYHLTISAPSPSTDLQVIPDETVISASETIHLTVTDINGSARTGWYAIPVTASGDGFSSTLTLHLLVGGSFWLFPLVIK
ncbi:MAG TPA: right-handed parallel beta-helix repeat-containing protein [Anaerolineaceae bacterium]|nr:right-handed parallel beta-helix repeat-containing protein [Anaerolineaceae bacterium]HPN52404.1 right-handed parallel beta-helix repeat-containing protein [Anaerolineaceae bacterium]